MDQNAPLLLRQQSQGAMEVVKGKSAFIMAVIGGILLAPAIACLVIATNYNASGTSCTGSYTVDLVTFLEVAGGLQISIGGLSLCCGIMSVMMEVPNGCAGGSGCAGLFYLIWAGIGLYMWCNQMSDDCKEDDIAKMVVAWSAIQYSFIPVICCFVCCMVCIMGTAVAAVGISQQAMMAQNADQAEPLNPQPEPDAADAAAADQPPAENVAV